MCEYRAGTTESVARMTGRVLVKFGLLSRAGLCKSIESCKTPHCLFIRSSAAKLNGYSVVVTCYNQVSEKKIKIGAFLGSLCLNQRSNSRRPRHL